MNETPIYLWHIWSNEHSAYWRQNSNGYTKNILEAGRYSEEEALKICKCANYGPIGGIPTETMIREDSFWK